LYTTWMRSLVSVTYRFVKSSSCGFPEKIPVDFNAS
jgi:hypothetical protein